MGKATTLKLTDLESNILRCYLNATEDDIESGSVWYDEAWCFANTLSVETGYTVEQVAAVIALTSPQAPWERNKQTATNVCHGRDGKFMTGRMREQCQQVLEGTADIYDLVSKGYKILAFYANILGHSDRVTIDSHAINLAHNESMTPVYRAKVFKSQELMDTYALAYSNVAALLGLTPSTLQAITWVTWRSRGTKPFVQP